MKDRELQKKEINEWLKNTPNDFESGLELFRKHSGNNSLESIIKRKRNLKLLTYQLRKIIGIHLVAAYSSDAITVKPLYIKTDSVSDSNDESFRILQFNRINPEKLPESQRKVYDEIAEAYKIQRVWHEKMKIADSDVKRSECREKLVELDDMISNSWKLLDDFVASGGKITEADEIKSVLDINKEIIACRSYICNAIRAIPSLSDKKKVKRIAEVQSRVNALIKLGACVSPDTHKALISQGVITKNSLLLIESQENKPEKKLKK